MNIFRRHQPSPQWSASLCGCGDDAGTCCITCCLPCITFGKIAEMVDEGKSCWNHGTHIAPPRMPPSMKR
ncbi:hypothetical protein V6N13_060754 [Hibiscus sabdariffa]